MREYAVLFDGIESDPTWSIIFRDTTDARHKWFVMQRDIRDEDTASILVEALNERERRIG